MLFLVLAVGVKPVDLSAQLPGAEFSLVGSAIESRSAINGDLETYRGFLYGIEARGTLDLLSLDIGYAQGSLDRTFVDFTGRQFVDGFARADLNFPYGFSVGAAGRARAYSDGSPSGPGLLRLAIGGGTEQGARRWLLWEFHGRYDANLIPDLFAIFADGWITRPGRINAGEVYHGGRGGEVGLHIRPGNPPLQVRFSYAVDEIRIGAQGRRETVERVTLAIGYRFSWAPAPNASRAR